MFQQDDSWYFYKRVLVWLGYALILILFVYLLFLTINFFFEKTFTETVVYEEFRVQYTAEPGDESELIDREKWKRNVARKNLNIGNFSLGYVHPFVTLTISFIIVIAIIGGIIIFRNYLKNPRK